MGDSATSVKKRFRRSLKTEQVLKHLRLLTKNSSPGQMIPPEMQIMEVCGVSRVTVRQAITQMVDEGFFYRIKGKGTFICDNQDKGFNNDLGRIVIASKAIPEGYHPYYSERLRGLMEVFGKNGFACHLVKIDKSVEKSLSGLEQVEEIKGMVVFALSKAEITSIRSFFSLPILSIRNAQQKVNSSLCHSFYLNVKPAYEKAFELLQHKTGRILFIGQNEELFRLCQKILGEKRVVVHRCRSTSEEGYEAIKMHWSSQTKTVVVSDDVVAQGVLRFLIEKNTNFRKDVTMITGCNKGAYLPFQEDFIQVVSDAYTWGKQSAQYLIDILEGKTNDSLQNEAQAEVFHSN